MKRKEYIEKWGEEAYKAELNKNRLYRNELKSKGHKTILSKEELLERSLRGPTSTGKLNWCDLPKIIKEMIHQHRPSEMYFNNLYIKYNTKDQYDTFCLHFIVSNAWTGNQKTIYNKDYMTKEGDLRYRALASAIRRT